jgi:hypothetical protein
MSHPERALRTLLWALIWSAVAFTLWAVLKGGF